MFQKAYGGSGAPKGVYLSQWQQCRGDHVRQTQDSLKSLQQRILQGFHHAQDDLSIWLLQVFGGGGSRIVWWVLRPCTGTPTYWTNLYTDTGLED